MDTKNHLTDMDPMKTTPLHHRADMENQSLKSTLMEVQVEPMEELMHTVGLLNINLPTAMPLLDLNLQHLTEVVMRAPMHQQAMESQVDTMDQDHNMVRNM